MAFLLSGGMLYETHHPLVTARHSFEIDDIAAILPGWRGLQLRPSQMELKRIFTLVLNRSSRYDEGKEREF